MSKGQDTGEYPSAHEKMGVVQVFLKKPTQLKISQFAKMEYGQTYSQIMNFLNAS
jgi:hypothetical protein